MSQWHVFFPIVQWAGGDMFCCAKDHASHREGDNFCQPLSDRQVSLFSPDAAGSDRSIHRVRSPGMVDNESLLASLYSS